MYEKRKPTESGGPMLRILFINGRNSDVSKYVVMVKFIQSCFRQGNAVFRWPGPKPFLIVKCCLKTIKHFAKNQLGSTNMSIFVMQGNHNIFIISVGKCREMYRPDFKPHVPPPWSKSYINGQTFMTFLLELLRVIYY